MKKLLAIAVLAGAAPLAFAQSEMPAPAASAPTRSEPYSIQEVDTVGEVVKVDKAKKQLTVKDAAGKKFKVNVPSDVAGFDTMKPGNLLELKYLPAYAISLNKAGESAGVITQDSVRLAPRGGSPAETTAKTKRASAMVMDFDRARGMITVKGPEGSNMELAVPEGFTGWDSIKVGDTLSVQYTEAVALSAGKREQEGAAGTRDFERTSTPMPQQRGGSDTRNPGSDPLYQQRNEPANVPSDAPNRPR